MKLRTCFVAAVVSVVSTLAATAADRPNIIVMMVDDMGFAGPSIAPYNNPNYKTPGMDRLAREGMLFTDFHSSGAICSATRAGLLTGRYQQRAGIEAVIHPGTNHPEHRKWLHASEVTFAELFKQAGYATGLVGKWHLGYPEGNDEIHPQNHGFDYFKGYHSGNIDYISHWGDHGKHDWWHGRKETVQEGYTTHLINKYALEFIEANKDKPFCLYVAQEAPHFPVQGPNDPVQRGPGRKKRVTPHKEAMKQMMLEMDKGVEQVRAKLVELGLEKNTLFLFFSDNGDDPQTATGSPRFRGHKGKVYEGGTRVPAIAWWPGRIEAGTRADDLSITLDVMPTILSVAGLAAPKDRPLDGVDLSPVLFKQESLPHRPLFWADLNNNGYRSEALRDDPWKLVVQHPKAKPGAFENPSLELFDLSKDESETTNLASEHPERAAEMHKRIKDWYAQMQKTATRQPGGWIRKPQHEDSFFNGKDLTGWKGNDGYWSVKDNAIVGHSDKNVPKNEFIWSNVTVNDFRLSVDVKLLPDARNAGIQFRSKPINEHGQALGYQADVGKGVWGKLYHEHGRGQLDWNNNAAGAVKPGEWNRYEILAVGHRIWTAINGKLCVAIDDPRGELSGRISFQVHSGQPQTVHYRNPKLIHNPKIELAGLTEQELVAKAKLVGGRKPTPTVTHTGDLPSAASTLNFDNAESIGAKTGKVTSVDSPIGGKALAFSERGSSVSYKLSDAWRVGEGPFSFSVWVMPNKLTQAGILCAGGYSYRHGWLLDCHPNGSVRLETATKEGQNNGTAKTPGGVLKPGHWSHIVVAVDDNRSARLFVNAKEMANGKLGKINLTNPKANLVVGAIENNLNASFQGKIDQIQIWKKVLTKTEVSDLWGGKTFKEVVPTEAVQRDGSVQRFADGSRKSPSKPFGKDGFQLEANDTVVFIGGANMVRSRIDGTLEGLLSLKFAEQKPRFRNMAWEGDTAYEQWRDIDFGSWTDQLRGVGASVLIVDFGQMEAIEGAGRLSDFVAAYEKLLDEYQQTTKRIVLLTPRPFEKPRSPHMIDHSAKNSDVKQYVAAIEQIAKRRDLICVDLFTPLHGSTDNLTSNGIHLDAASHAEVAELIAETLGVSPQTSSQFDAFLVAIREKNRLWYDNWRPMNWSFAFGDRTNQQFGKSFKEHPPLKTELAVFKPLIRNADEQIHATAVAIVSGQPARAFQPVAAKLTYPKQQVDPAEHTSEAELATFTPAEGFEVNLFADESDGVVKPVQMRWDDQGRLWVACIPTYPHIEPGAMPGDYILVCEDTDQDGRADKFTRFAEGLFIAMGIEFGDGGVYVSEATDIVLLKDTDGDGKADTREIILSGFGTADSHQMVNNIHRGPCGDFWFTQGHHAFSRVETPWGISKLSKAGVWRYRPKTGQLDGFFDKSKAGLNCQGITHDDWGQTFHNSAAASGGFYTSAGAISASPRDGIGPIVKPPERNTGIEFVGTEHLPADLQGDIVWSGFMNNNLQRRRLIDAGSGFKGEKMPNLLQSSSRSFRPVNAKVGPDGGIYICDWYNSIIGHYQSSYRDPARDRTRGRIWRLTATGRPLSKAPKLTEMSPQQLLNQLRSKERLTRINAKKRLFDMPTDNVIAATDDWVAALDKDQDYERMLMTAAGVYAAHEIVNTQLLQKLLGADDPRVRAFSARLVGRWNSRLDSPLELLRQCVQDEHPRVRLEAVVACSHIQDVKAMEVASMAADRPRDHYLNYAMKLCVTELKPYWAPALARGEFDFGRSPERLRWILELDGTKDSAQFVRQLASTTGISEEAREGLLSLLAGLGTSSDLQFIMNNSIHSPAVLRELVAVAEVHKRRPNGDLEAGLRPLLTNKDAETRSLAVQLAGLWEMDSLSDEISKQLSGPDAPQPVTEAALIALVRLKGPAAVETVARYATPKQPAGVQVAAVQAAILSDLSKAAELSAVLLSRSNNAELTGSLVSLFLNRNKGMESLNKAFVELAAKGQPLAADPAVLMHRALSTAGRTDNELVTTLNVALGKKASTVATYSSEYVKQLAEEVRQSGNANLGKKVYQSKLANCASCHRIGGIGGTQGPDLSIIGAGRSEEQLAESVLWPNRQVREGFMSIKVLTAEGRIFIGYPVKETDEELHLRDSSTNQIRRIAEEDIDAKIDAGSIMPASLTAGMTRTELRNLIRYLSSMRGTQSDDRGKSDANSSR